MQRWHVRKNSGGILLALILALLITPNLVSAAESGTLNVMRDSVGMIVGWMVPDASWEAAQQAMPEMPWAPILVYWTVVWLVIWSVLVSTEQTKRLFNYKWAGWIAFLLGWASTFIPTGIVVIATIFPFAVSIILPVFIIYIIIRVVKDSRTLGAAGNEAYNKARTAEVESGIVKDKAEEEKKFADDNIKHSKATRKEINALLDKDFRSLLTDSFKKKLEAARQIIQAVQKIPDQSSDEVKNYIQSAKKYVAAAFSNRRSKENEITQLERALRKQTSMQLTKWQAHSGSEDTLVTALKKMAEHNTKRKVDETSQRMEAIKNIASQIMSHNAEVAKFQQQCNEVNEVIVNLQEQWVQINQTIVSDLESKSLEDAVSAINKALQLDDEEQRQLTKLVELEKRMRMLHEKGWAWMNDNEKILARIEHEIIHRGETTRTEPKGDYGKKEYEKGKKEMIITAYKEIEPYLTPEFRGIDTETLTEEVFKTIIKSLPHESQRKIFSMFKDPRILEFLKREGIIS